MSAAESGDWSGEDASTASSMGGGGGGARNRGAAAAMRRTSGLHPPALTAVTQVVQSLQQQFRDLAAAQEATAAAQKAAEDKTAAIMKAAEDRTAGMFASIMAAMQQPAQAQSAARQDVGTPMTPAPAGGTSPGTTAAAGRSPLAMDNTSSSTLGGPTSLTVPGALLATWRGTFPASGGAGGADTVGTTLTAQELAAQHFMTKYCPDQFLEAYLTERTAPPTGGADKEDDKSNFKNFVSSDLQQKLRKETKGVLTDVDINKLVRAFMLWIEERPSTMKACQSPLVSLLRQTDERLSEPESGSLLNDLYMFQQKYPAYFSLKIWGAGGVIAIVKTTKTSATNMSACALLDLAVARALIMYRNVHLVSDAAPVSRLNALLHEHRVTLPLRLAGANPARVLTYDKWLSNLDDFIKACAVAEERIGSNVLDWHKLLFEFEGSNTVNHYMSLDLAREFKDLPSVKDAVGVAALGRAMRQYVTAQYDTLPRLMAKFGYVPAPAGAERGVGFEDTTKGNGGGANGAASAGGGGGAGAAQQHDKERGRGRGREREEERGREQSRPRPKGQPCEEADCPQLKASGEHALRDCHAVCKSTTCAAMRKVKDHQDTPPPAGQHIARDCQRVAETGSKWRWPDKPLEFEGKFAKTAHDWWKKYIESKKPRAPTPAGERERRARSEERRKGEPPSRSASQEARKGAGGGGGGGGGGSGRR
jgi:hypothetical protein